MFVSCDLTSAFEDGGIGGVIGVLLVAVAMWVKSAFFSSKPGVR